MKVVISMTFYILGINAIRRLIGMVSEVLLFMRMDYTVGFPNNRIYPKREKEVNCLERTRIALMYTFWR